jgi:endonuclease-3
MSSPNRSALLVKAHKLLRKHYEPVPRVERSLLEHLIFACLLENSSYAAAEQALAALRKVYFDLNEIRVSSVAELGEHIGGVYDPKAAAWNLRRVLHGVFEATYSFDIESYKKKNLGQATKDLGKIAGVTPFVLAYATQAGLDGHSIPIDKGAMEALLILGVVNPKEAESGEVPGMERAIPKNKGIEFGSLLHQLGVDLLTRPFAQEVRDLLVAINPQAKDRLPKRTAKKKEEETPPAKPEPAPVAKAAAPAPAKSAATKAPEKPVPAKPVDKKKEALKDGAKTKAPTKPASASEDNKKKKPDTNKKDPKSLARTKPR